MSRRYLPNDDAPRRGDCNEFDVASPARSSHDEINNDVARPRPWWNRELGATPVIAVGLGIAVVVVIVVVVIALAPREAAQRQQNVVNAPPPVFLPSAAALEPGTVCTISNLRLTNHSFGGQPSLTFDYDFPGGQDRRGPQLLVAVVTGPGNQRAIATLTPLMFDKGAVTVATLEAFAAFPRGTTLYVGTQIEDGPDGLPKRVSNILVLE